MRRVATVLIVGLLTALPACAGFAGGPFDTLHFRQIGPASMSGRISDLAVYEANPAIFYVATAHGGVWKTVNAGTTFEAQFQSQGLMAIGDVAVSQSNAEKCERSGYGSPWKKPSPVKPTSGPTTPG